MGKPRMTSRERVLSTIRHREPDRVPFNLTLTADSYHHLREYLGLPRDDDAKMGIWTNVSPTLDLVEVMQVDICYVGLNPPTQSTPLQRDDGLMYDEWGIGREKVVRLDGGFYFEMVQHPLADVELQDLDDFPWPDPYDPGRIERLREKVLRIRRESDKAIMAKFSNSIWELSWWMRGMERWLIDMIENPALCEAIMDRLCELAMGFVDVGLEAIGDLVDILRLAGEDLGTQEAPMISPAMFNELVQPRFERLWRFAKRRLLEKNPAAKLMLHSCGNVRPFIPTWIDMGIDILDPIQPRAANMEPESLKTDFGESLVFHGGVDLQHTLPFGTPDDVMQEVKRYIQALGPGGGYIVAPAHNVQSDVPVENLVAIRDAIEAYGYYPIA